MFDNLTRMEKWITNEYLINDIHSPDAIKMEKSTIIYDVTVWKFPMGARYDIFKGNRFISIEISIDSRTSPIEQREQFFHELCHVLFHVGHQTIMHEPFRQLLEWEAYNFVMYAALPYHMIKQYDLTYEYLMHELAADFKVTKSLCQKRLEQIKNRIQNNSLLIAEQTYLYN